MQLYTTPPPCPNFYSCRAFSLNYIHPFRLKITTADFQSRTVFCPLILDLRNNMKGIHK